MHKRKANDDRGGEGRKEGRREGGEFGGGCAATAVWPVDYGAETRAGVSLQPVSDSVFARGYKEKDGERADSRGKKHAYATEKARAGGERPRAIARGKGRVLLASRARNGGGRRVKRAVEGSAIIREGGEERRGARRMVRREEKKARRRGRRRVDRRDNEGSVSGGERREEEEEEDASAEEPRNEGNAEENMLNNKEMQISSEIRDKKRDGDE